MVRRTVAFGVGLLVLILFVVGVRGCLDSRKESSITNYVSDVDALVRESNQLSTQLFEQLQGGDGGTSDVDAQNALASFRIQAVQLVDRAADLDTPGDLEGAQGYLIDTLEFRAQGVGQIAENLPNALTDGAEQEGAADAIAEAMQLFLTSDRIYQYRVRPLIDDVLTENDLEQNLANSTFLEDLSWLDASEVASRIGGLGSDEDTDAADDGGVHGTGLGTVTLGGVALVPGGSATLTAGDDLAFEVQVTNQGDSTESDIAVTATVGSGSDAIEADGVIDTIAPGEAQTVEIPLGETPPTGQAVPVTVEVELVEGEDESIGNNSAEYSVIFTS